MFLLRRVIIVLAGLVVASWTSSCLPSLSYEGIACSDDNVCGGGLACIEGICRDPREVLVTSINGDGLQAPPVYPTQSSRPKSPNEATRRFRKAWRIKGWNLDRLTGLRLRLKQPNRKEYNAKDGLTLSGGSATERVVMLPKNMVAGMFLLIGLIGNTEVALGEVFVLQGEGCKIVKSQSNQLTIQCGDTQSTLKAPEGSGLSPQEKGYLSALQTTVKVDTTNRKVTFENVNVHIENGQQKTASVNGTGNLIVGYNETGGANLKRTGSHNLIVGPEHSYDSYGGIVAGKQNQVTGPHAAVLGGQQNLARGKYSTVVGGNSNKAFGTESSVLGGLRNQTGAPNSEFSGQFSTISGGEENYTVGLYSSVTGGSGNTAEGTSSSITGGEKNVAWSVLSSIAGGSENEAGSASNRHTTSHATVSGGRKNIVRAQYAVISSGFNNRVTGTYGSVHGGSQNQATGEGATVLGGKENVASQTEASALGGYQNKASAEQTTTVGGKGNEAIAIVSVTIGGEGNKASSAYSTLLGGKGRNLQTTNTHTCNAACP